MGLLKKKKKKSSMGSRMSGGAGASALSPLRPSYVEKLPPCTGHCPSGNDIRGWLMTISLREKLGLSLDEAYEKAFHIEAETNPFPSVMGRVCPHPCEASCNRNGKDEAVAINSVEREIGDYALEHDLKLEKIEGEGPYPEKVAVIGAGPAGLSCAYQMARRGYQVTVFESLPEPGGMLRYGIPVYRQPRGVLDGEIQRIADLGVEIRCNTAVGKDVAFADIQKEYAAIFLGIGAHKGKKMGIPGEEGDGVWTGTEFLNKINRGDTLDLGDKVVIIGGGDTAIDAARVSKRVAADSAALSKRMGAQVTVLYRRTRQEMPAIEREIDEALEEDINIEFLAAPVKILRDENGAMKGMMVQRMELGEPDDSGRRRPIPIDGDVYELECNTMVAAVSQQPDLETLGVDTGSGKWIEADEWGKTGLKGMWTGGDNLGLGLATISIGQGRNAAISMHAELRGEELPRDNGDGMIGQDRIDFDYYDAMDRAERTVRSPEARLADPLGEVDEGITREEAVEETMRCFSCGKCFGCENCWMYCQNSVFKPLDPPTHGSFYSIKMELCDGCKKCWEECPCGFIDGQ